MIGAVDSEDVGDEAELETDGDTEETKDSGEDTGDDSISWRSLASPAGRRDK